MGKRYWRRIAKALIVTCAILAYGYIIRKLVAFEHWDTLIHSFSLSGKTILIVASLLILWGINLICETKKWQTLMQPYVQINFKNAWQQIMAGTTTAVGSPARIAEMGGRMALLPKQLRVNAALMTSIGGIIQNIVIFIGGVLTLLFNSNLSHQFKLPIKFIEIAILILVIVLLLTLSLRLIFPGKFKYYLRIIQHTNRKNLLKALIWTSLRYLTYIIQLYAWLFLWGFDANLIEFIPIAALYFFLITIIPSHILVDMGIRGSIAILLFSAFFSNTPLILAAVFCLWSSNVIIPTIIGSFILVRQKLIKQRVIQKET